MSKTETEVLIEPQTTAGFDMLKGLSGGDLPFTYTEKLKEVLSAVLESEKQGEIVLKVKIIPEPTYGGRAHRFIPEITIKKPSLPPQFSMRFVTDKLDVLTDDPRQLKFSDLKTKLKED